MYVCMHVCKHIYVCIISTSVLYIQASVFWGPCKNKGGSNYARTMFELCRFDVLIWGNVAKTSVLCKCWRLNWCFVLTQVTFWGLDIGDTGLWSRLNIITIYIYIKYEYHWSNIRYTLSHCFQQGDWRSWCTHLRTQTGLIIFLICVLVGVLWRIWCFCGTVQREMHRHIVPFHIIGFPSFLSPCRTLRRWYAIAEWSACSPRMSLEKSLVPPERTSFSSRASLVGILCSGLIRSISMTSFNPLFPWKLPRSRSYQRKLLAGWWAVYIL